MSKGGLPPLICPVYAGVILWVELQALVLSIFLRALSKHTRISGFRSKTHERRERKLSVVESTPPMKLRRNSAAWKQICVRRGKRFNS